MTLHHRATSILSMVIISSAATFLVSCKPDSKPPPAAWITWFPPSDPAEVGLDPLKLDAAVAIYREAVTGDAVMRGAFLAVVKDGRLVLEESLGWHDVEAGVPFTRDTLFHLASNTKAYIGVAVQILVEDGCLRPDDLVRHWIPAFANRELADITVEQLVTHSSGLPRGPIFLPNIEENTTLRDEAARFAEHVEMVSPPGETYHYSNVGYNVLGAVIEAASGQSLADFLRQRIFEPLDMDATYCHESEVAPERLGPIYRRKDDDWRRQTSLPPRYPIVRASGGLISSARDQGTWIQMFLDRGLSNGKRLLAENSIEAILTPRAPIDENDILGPSYGYGWSIHADGCFSHGGSDGTFIWADPESRMFALMFTQSPTRDQPREDFYNALKAAVIR